MASLDIIRCDHDNCKRRATEQLMPGSPGSSNRWRCGVYCERHAEMYLEQQETLDREHAQAEYEHRLAAEYEHSRYIPF